MAHPAMSIIYSTRFLLVAAGGATDYLVQPTKLAVIRSITIMNQDPAVQWALVQILPAGVAVAGGYYQPIGTSPFRDVSVYDVRIPVSAGETIRVARATATLHVSVSGYLFNV